MSLFGSLKHPCIFLCTFLFCGCLNLKQPAQEFHYYTLHYDPPVVENLPQLPATIVIKRFAVAPLYDSTHIIYGDTAFTKNTYYYHKWRSNPGDQVTMFLKRDLTTSRRFQAVLAEESCLSNVYVVNGSVEEFFEYDKDDGWEAILGIRLTLNEGGRGKKEMRVCYQKQYRATELCDRKHPIALSAAMGRAMARVSVLINTDIYQYIQAELNGKKHATEG